MDPYKILGVPYDASDDDIKRAYRTLVRKYHPDANINNPDKEQTTAKFQQVQQAYDMIMKSRQNGGSSWSYQNGGYEQGGYEQGGYGPDNGYSQGPYSESPDDWYMRHARQYGYEPGRNTGDFCLSFLPFCWCFCC